MVAFSVIASTALAACGLIPGLDDPLDDCDPWPIGETGLQLQFGPGAVSATTCEPVIRVDGLDYYPDVGRWLDEDDLSLREYGPITHASWPVGDTVAYALEGVDPERVLVIKTAPTKESGEWGQYTLLRRDGLLPRSVCDDADTTDPYYPSRECPLVVGQRYPTEMKTACGLEKTMGPYGGSYWRVIDPPQRIPRAMSRKTAHGTMELLPDGRLRFRSNGGGVLFLATTEGSAEDVACRLP
jgi:hypothetical protein